MSFIFPYSLSCLQFNILSLLHSLKSFNSFLSINICLLWNPSPNEHCVLFKRLLHWFLVSQEKPTLIWSNVFFLKGECELQRVLDLRHAMCHVFIPPVKMYAKNSWYFSPGPVIWLMNFALIQSVKLCVQKHLFYLFTGGGGKYFCHCTQPNC